MPARDRFHEIVRAALVREGWTITADPVTIVYGKRSLYVDLGAEQLLSATREGRRIVVEVKSFAGPSEMADLELALGQYILYRTLLDELDSGSEIFLALPVNPYVSIFEDPLGELLLEKQALKLIVFEPLTGEIMRWIG